MESLAFITEILLPALMEGLLVTLQLIIIAAPFGFLAGIGVAVGRTYGGKIPSFICKVYVAFVKGCPLLLLLFILYFTLPSVGIVFTAFEASIIGFIMCNSAYNSEYIRGAIKSIKEGQIIAARSLGMTKYQSIFYIVLPQALRRAIPGLSNEFIYLIKYSSLAYMLTVIELTGAGKLIATKYFTYTETFIFVGAIYLVLVTITTVGAGMIEKKFAVPGSQGR